VIYHEGTRLAQYRSGADDDARPTPSDIDSYLDHAWPDVSSSVGAYHAEGYGARLFSRIDGDWFSVLGLPLLGRLSFLRLRGWLAP
jgi:septum formation protein